MRWDCLLFGRIHLPNGKIREVHRYFDGGGDVKNKAIAELLKRRDRGSPWYGDAVYVLTPLGKKIIVDVPWPH